LTWREAAWDFIWSDETAVDFMRVQERKRQRFLHGEKQLGILYGAMRQRLIL
jgi:hypothetical protein